MKTREDFQILEEMLDVIEDLRQRSGGRPRLTRASSSRTLRRAVVRFREECNMKLLEGRSRRRRAKELFKRLVSLYPSIWRT
jgi:hypothetical protein